MADLENKVRAQIEFYFSDSNFPRDKFLREQAAQNEEGYVPLQVLLTFPRLKVLTEDLNVIKAALRDSVDLKLSSDETTVKRINPLPGEDTSKDRTIYAKGFPQTGYTIEDVTGVFKQFGTVKCVRIRRFKDKQLKASCFIEFATPEEAKKALSQKVSHQGKELLTMMIGDYVQSKKEERMKAIEKKRKAEDSKGAKSDKSEKEDKKEKKEPERTNENTIIRFKGLKDDVSRETVKSVFSAYGDVAFVDFKLKDTEGYIRFRTPEAAKKAADDLKANPKEIGGKVPSEIALLTTEEVDAYWKNTKLSQANSGKHKKGKRRRF